MRRYRKVAVSVHRKIRLHRRLARRSRKRARYLSDGTQTSENLRARTSNLNKYANDFAHRRKVEGVVFPVGQTHVRRKIAKYFENACAVENAKGLVESYLEAARRDGLITKEYENKYGKYPENVAPAEVKEAMQKNAFCQSR